MHSARLRVSTKDLALKNLILIKQNHRMLNIRAQYKAGPNYPVIASSLFAHCVMKNLEELKLISSLCLDDINVNKLCPELPCVSIILISTIGA